MDALHRFTALEVGPAGALEGELAAQGVGGLADRAAGVVVLGGPPALLLVLEAPELSLGLCAG